MVPAEGTLGAAIAGERRLLTGLTRLALLLRAPVRRTARRAGTVVPRRGRPPVDSIDGVGDGCDGISGGAGVPNLVGMRSHGASRLVICGSQLIPHGRWQAAQEVTEEKQLRHSLSGEEGKHLGHHRRWAAVAEVRVVENGETALPAGLPEIDGELLLESPE